MNFPEFLFFIPFSSSFSKIKIKQIKFVRQARRSGLNKPSVLDAKHNENAFSETKFRRDALLGMCSTLFCLFARMCIFSLFL